MVAHESAHPLSEVARLTQAAQHPLSEVAPDLVMSIKGHAPLQVVVVFRRRLADVVEECAPAQLEVSIREAVQELVKRFYGVIQHVQMMQTTLLDALRLGKFR